MRETILAVVILAIGVLQLAMAIGALLGSLPN